MHLSRSLRNKTLPTGSSLCPSPIRSFPTKVSESWGPFPCFPLRVHHLWTHPYMLLFLTGSAAPPLRTSVCPSPDLFPVASPYPRGSRWHPEAGKRGPWLQLPRRRWSWHRPLYRLAHMDGPSHRDPEESPPREPDQQAPAYLACCTGHLSGFPRNTCRMTWGLMKSTRLTSARGTYGRGFR